MPRRRVAEAADLPRGAIARVEVDGLPICLVHAPDDNIYALLDTCTHEEQSLSEGDLWGMEIECPGHLSRFDVRTGRVKSPPAELDARTFKVALEDGGIFIDY